MWEAVVQSVLQTKTHWRAYYLEQGFDLVKLNSRESFNKLPVLKKYDLPLLQKDRPPFGGFVQEDEVVRIFVSPGPIYDPQGEERDYWRFGPLLSKLGVNHLDTVQNTFSYHLSPAGFMFDSAARALGAKVIPAGTGNSEIQVDVMGNLKTTVFAGTPSFLVHLLRLAEEKGFVFGKDLVLNKAIFTAEQVTTEMDLIFQEKNILYLDTYGTADVGCIAYRYAEEDHFNVVDGVMVQICDPVTGEEVEDGETGEVVISLASQVYPLIRFGTGDLSRWQERDVSIAGILGRVGESYKVKGMFVHSHQLDQAVKSISQIRDYRAKIDHTNGQDHFVVEVELNEGKDHSELAQSVSSWENMLKEKLRVRPTIEIVRQGSMQQEGKKLVDLRVPHIANRSCE